MEFSAAVTVYGICTDEKEQRLREFIQKDKLISNILMSLNEEMSRFNKSEYAYFNQLYILEVCMEAFIFDNPKIISAEDYFNTLEKCDSLQLLKYIVGCVWGTNELDGKEFDKFADSLDNLKKLVVMRSDQLDKISDDLIEMITYPEETRNRICNLLKVMYRIYSQFEGEVLTAAKKLKEKWKVDYKNCSDEFIDEYDIWNIKDSLKKKATIFVYVNYCFSFINQFKIYDDNTVFLNIGFREREFRLNQKLDMELFYKAISDDTRRKMLREFATRACYLRELALKLNVKASTINHHMQVLSELGLVKITSEENGLRQYYELDHKKVNEYLKCMKNELFLESEESNQ